MSGIQAISKKDFFYITVLRGAKFTKGKKWKLIYSKRYYDKSEAMKEEFKLKKNYNKRNVIKKMFLTKNEIN
jgi:putative endonuclease